MSQMRSLSVAASCSLGLCKTPEKMTFLNFYKNKVQIHYLNLGIR